jgi:hypothetical protein
MPEQGDADRPELIFFIDEAHLIFRQASKALLEQIEAIVKLIRSKGVGIYFVTQNPKDIPDEVLAQLGLKIQHALRAFTAKDRQAIKLASQNFPLTDYYDTDEVLTSLGIGEALVTVLGRKGRPTPLAATMMRAPMSRMDILSDRELKKVIKNSDIREKYEEVVDKKTAYEILKVKIEKAEKKKEEVKKAKIAKRKKDEPGMIEKVLKSSTGKLIIREITRSLLGVLGIGSSYRRRRR